MFVILNSVLLESYSLIVVHVLQCNYRHYKVAFL